MNNAFKVGLKMWLVGLIWGIILFIPYMFIIWLSTKWPEWMVLFWIVLLLSFFFVSGATIVYFKKWIFD